MKTFAVFVLFLAGLAPCHADTFDVTASCNASPECSIPFTMTAVFTTQLEFGNWFFTPSSQVIMGITVPAVVDITGTFNGLPMTLIPLPENDWLLVQGGFALPMGVAFSAGGVEYGITSNPGPRLGLDGNAANGELIAWTAVEVPEPPAFWLLFTAPLLLGLSKWAGQKTRSV